MSTTEATSTSSANVCSDHGPKRVILRLQVNEFEGNDRNWEQHVDAIKAYLVWAGRPMSEYVGEYETRKHFAHVEPFQVPELKQTTFHVILDIEQHLLNGPDFDTLPHEIYRVRRDNEGNLVVHPFQKPLVAKNMISRIRKFTDVVYPWAGQRVQKRPSVVVSQTLNEEDAEDISNESGC